MVRRVYSPLPYGFWHLVPLSLLVLQWNLISFIGTVFCPFTKARALGT